MTRIPYIILLAGAVLALLVAAWPANSEPVKCGPFADAVAQLEARHGETVKIVLQGSPGALVVFLNAETGTWTMVAVGPDRACYISHGLGVVIKPDGVLR